MVRTLLGTVAALSVLAAPLGGGARPEAEAAGSGLKGNLSSILASAFPLHFGQPGDRITFSDPNVSFPSDQRVSVRVKARHKKTRGIPQYTASGSGTIEGRLQLGPTTACVTGLVLTDVNLRNVNDLLDQHVVAKELNRRMQTVCTPPGCMWEPTRTAFCATVPQEQSSGAAPGGDAADAIRGGPAAQKLGR